LLILPDITNRYLSKSLRTLLGSPVNLGDLGILRS